MHNRSTILASCDIGWLREELIKAQELNTKLHRRLQRCEGADTKLEKMKDKMRRQTFRYIELYRDDRKYWKKLVSKMSRQVNSSPFFIKWLYKL